MQANRHAHMHIHVLFRRGWKDDSIHTSHTHIHTTHTTNMHTLLGEDERVKVYIHYTHTYEHTNSRMHTHVRYQYIPPILFKVWF